MPRIETGSLEEIVYLPNGKGFLKAIGGPQFLAAQIFTILATILGVYLAGYISFQRTLEYDRYQKAQQRLDILTATQEELKQNITILQNFCDQIADVESGTNRKFLDDWRKYLPELHLFVWQSAGRSSSAFDVPPQILTDLQSLYGAVGKMLTNAQTYGASAIALPRFLSESGNGSRHILGEQLSAQVKFAETSILPALDKAIGASGQLVKKYAAADDTR